MGIKTKAPKGEITVENFRGRIRLRWRHEGERYSLSLPHPYLTENLYHATIKTAEIKLDIMKGCFDPTLEKYKQPESPAKSLKNKILKIDRPIQIEKDHILLLHELVEKYNEWGANIKNVDVEGSVHYLYVRRLLEKWVAMPVTKAAEYFK